MVALASSIFEKEKIDFGRKVALIAAFFGISLAIGPSFTVLDWRGIILALIGAFGVMMIFIFTGQALKHTSATVVSLYSNLLALPLMAIIMIYFFDGYQKPNTISGMYSLLCVCSLYGIAILMQFAAIHSIGKTLTALLSNVEPLVSISAGAILLNETLTGIQYLGGVTVVTSLVISDYLAKQKMR